MESNEVVDNKIYKEYVKDVLAKDIDSFCPFRKEKQMDYLFAWLKDDFKVKGQKILDICCGYGRLIHFLNEFDSEQAYYGIDYEEDLIKKGKRQFKSFPNIKFEHSDAYNLSKNYPNKAFDITINYKTLYCMPYYEAFILELLKVTKNKIFITSPFYDGDIDFITKIYTNQSKDNFIYLNTYSLPKFKKFCKNYGVKAVNTIDMKLDFDLPPLKDKNKLQTFTVNMAEGSRLEVTGNIILSWKLVELVL